MNVIEDKKTMDVFEVTGEVRPPEDGESYIVSFDAGEYLVGVADHKWGEYKDRIIVKPTRWRARKNDESYYYISVLMEVGVAMEDGSFEDDALYESKNYFRTREIAEKVLDRFNKTLRDAVVLR